MSNFPRMIDGRYPGQLVHASENKFVNTPNGLDEETAWKLAGKNDKGAIDVFGGDIYVAIDRTQSIANNRKSIQEGGQSIAATAKDHLDIARHAFLRMIGR